MASSSPSPAGNSADSKKSFPTSLIVPALLTVLVIVFIAMNRQTVSIWLIARVNLPIWAAFTVVALVGLAVGFMLGRKPKKKPTV